MVMLHACLASVTSFKKITITKIKTTGVTFAFLHKTLKSSYGVTDNMQRAANKQSNSPSALVFPPCVLICALHHCLWHFIAFIRHILFFLSGIFRPDLVTLNIFFMIILTLLTLSGGRFCVLVWLNGGGV